MKNEIILYRPDEFAEHIEVKIDDETIYIYKGSGVKTKKSNRNLN